VSCAPWDAPSVELTAGEGNSGMYHAYMTNIPEAKFTSLILVHEWAVMPNYSGAATTFLFRTDDAQATAKLKHHVTELVKVPVFDAWSDYLYSAGQTASLVRPTRSAGAIDVLTIDLDATAWTGCDSVDRTNYRRLECQRHRLGEKVITSEFQGSETFGQFGDRERVSPQANYLHL